MPFFSTNEGIREIKICFLINPSWPKAATTNENSRGFYGCHPERSEGSDMIFLVQDPSLRSG